MLGKEIVGKYLLARSREIAPVLERVWDLAQAWYLEEDEIYQQEALVREKEVSVPTSQGEKRFPVSVSIAWRAKNVSLRGPDFDITVPKGRDPRPWVLPQIRDPRYLVKVMDGIQELVQELVSELEGLRRELESDPRIKEAEEEILSRVVLEEGQ